MNSEILILLNSIYNQTNLRGENRFSFTHISNNFENIQTKTNIEYSPASGA